MTTRTSFGGVNERASAGRRAARAPAERGARRAPGRRRPGRSPTTGISASSPTTSAALPMRNAVPPGVAPRRRAPRAMIEAETAPITAPTRAPGRPIQPLTRSPATTPTASAPSVEARTPVAPRGEERGEQEARREAEAERDPDLVPVAHRRDCTEAATEAAPYARCATAGDLALTRSLAAGEVAGSGVAGRRRRSCAR